MGLAKLVLLWEPVFDAILKAGGEPLGEGHILAALTAAESRLPLNMRAKPPGAGCRSSCGGESTGKEPTFSRGYGESAAFVEAICQYIVIVITRSGNNTSKSSLN